MEPTSSASIAALLAKFGISKVWIAVAGFAGAIGSLMFLKGLTRGQMVFAVGIGFTSSFFCTPIVVHQLGWQEPQELAYGIAYVIGLSAMSAIPALKAALRKRLGARP